ncbi:MAG: patatin-like phospholipase family protein, partial [Candidatus Aenigmarchaeota archaeon]|nr:patatin-like phospholipase family protein [Candidatus Aenigmarchaeota archaeon]
LSGGSARGLAHIGFLQVLEKAGIRPDTIIGTSMGALIGGLYSAGAKLKEVEKTVKKIGKLQEVLLFASWPQKSGLNKGDQIIKIIKKFIGDQKIENLPTSFYAVATDINTGKKVVIHQGSLIKAIRASFAVPGLFTPIKLGDKILVDGGVIDSLSLDVANRLRGQLVIVSDILSRCGKTKITSYSGMIAILLRTLEIIREPSMKITPTISKNTIIVQSPMEKVNWLDYHRAEQIINIGRLATQKKLMLIKARFKKVKE